MNNVKFSVIIPTLNEELFLPKLLDSLTKQTVKDFEVIVVDGRSEDKTVALARDFFTLLPRLTIVTDQERNLPLQRNVGAQKARGDWFIFADADAVFVPWFISRIDQFIQEEHPKLFTTWFYPDSHVGSDALLTLLGNMMIESSNILHRSLTPGPLTIVTREGFSSIGGYNESLRFGEDYDFGQRLVATGFELMILRETLCMFSLRRFRRQGKLKMLNKYLMFAFRTLLTKKPPKDVSDYIMGGHLYRRDKKSKEINV